MNTYTLIRYFDCKMTPEEEAQVRAWLIDDPTGVNAEKYRSVHMTYMAQKLFLEDPLIAKPKGRNRLKSALVSCAKIAAIITIIVASGIWSNFITVERLAKQMETITVPAGERLQMTLKDGTEIWLNSGTQVEIPVVFSHKGRNIRLVEGEVLMDVAKDASKPFVVETWAGNIEVLGTRFNVAADKEEQVFTTALLEGSVKITCNVNPENEYILEPNDIATMVEGSLNVGRVKNVSAVESWTSGLIDVTDIPFDELMKKFEKAYDVRIFIDREELPVVTYTRGKIRVSDGIDHALSVLQLAADFSYSVDRVTGTVIIK